jgi:hypothetical protein
MQAKEGHRGGVTPRAVLVGLLFVPVNVYLVVQWETVWGTQYPTTMSIFFNAVFCLLLVTLVNLAWRRFLPRGALSQGELLTVYAVLLAAVAVSGHDFTQSVYCTLGTARWFATPENEWRTLFWRHLPRWLTVNDVGVLQGFFEGQSTFYAAQHMRGWARPMLWWTAALTTLVFVMLCVNALIRRQWIEREKLTYPLVHLPYEMTRDDAARVFFRNRLLWIGFALAAGLDVLNGVHFLLPTVPGIPVMFDASSRFTERPWDAMGGLRIYLNPYAVGLGFAVPLDLLFSCWVFFLTWKAQRVVGSVAGVDLPGYPFPDQQILGGYLGIAAVAIWMARKPLWANVRAAVRRPPRGESPDEPMPYRFAAAGLALGLAALVGFASAAGMTPLFALAFFAFYLVLMFAFTRMRAELGPPLQGIHYSGPIQLAVATVGSRRIPPQTLTAAAPFWTFTKELRNNPMPFQLESLKLADRARMDTRRLWPAILFASAVGIAGTFWAFLDLSYRRGGIGAWRGVAAYGAMERWLNRPTDPDVTFLAAVAVGFAVVMVNTALRLRYLWWALHPLGYPLAGYYHWERLWFPFFLAWAVKWAVLRYGGTAAYRKALALFLGLVLGEFVLGSIWGVWGLATGERTYAFKDW